MSANDSAARWGLPEGFEPVRFPISDEVKDLLRGLLAPGEPVVVTVANESDTVSIIATTQRLFSVRTGQGAGVTGFTAREFIWEAISDLRLTQMGMNVKIAVYFKSKDGGRTAEIGQRAKFSKDAVDELKPFEVNAGTVAFEAVHAIWHVKLGHASS